uniref:uncharacterized protein LOC124057118 n=1 Tax=Scatophagus argus TaxID=75038 RepID=UPI001ED803CD|nr:uncharacterized protein LOC124057118 [Scatophagus argus]
MFCVPCRKKKKKCQTGVEVGDTRCFSPRRSVKVEEDPKQGTVVPDPPTNTATTVTATADAQKGKVKKISWWCRFFSFKKKTKQQIPVKADVSEDTNLPSSDTEQSVSIIQESKVGECGESQEESPSPDTPVSAASELQLVREDVAADTTLPPSATEKSVVQESEGAEAGVLETPTPDTQNADVAEDTHLSSSPTEHRRVQPPHCINLLTDGPEFRLCSVPPGHGGSVKAEIYEHPSQPLTSASARSVSREELVCLGLPNLAQTCYMNSTLQGLLTLTGFIQEVHNQQMVWSSHPESQFIRQFVEVGVCRFTDNNAEKKGVLAAFKMTVAEFNSEFEDDDQKDAHEFLSCVLTKLRTLSDDLLAAAVDMGISYICPVNAHITFQMLDTRTCKGCGVQSTRVEDYLNLSLDLVPGGSVSQFLQEYLTENQLVCRCECGGEDSSHKYSFLTLPK